MSRRYSDSRIRELAAEVREESLVVLRGHLDRRLLDRWRAEFEPLLARHVEREGDKRNRGPARYYVTLPFRAPFADPAVYADPDLLALVDELVGPRPVMCQLATDTPLLGSDYQEVHRDAPPLFPEWGRETPPFQLAVNFALCDVTADNGPLELVRGTHMISKDEGLARLARGEARLEPVYLELGDVIVRDVRHLHRGTPNRTPVPRPMVVIGYSRAWQRRPEVSIDVPREAWHGLSERARELLRDNPVVERLDDSGGERYQAFAY
jgi:ectoine hydroxylase-related dioxygenase (phytanoyl-CoA dioxygenase family)